MAFVRYKTINGIKYGYLVKSVREGGKVRQIHIKYVGRDNKPIADQDLSNDFLNPSSSQKQRERQLITQFGGSVKKGYGFDGFIGNDPVEVKEANKDNRFRIGKDTHKKLLSRGGYYILDARGKKPVLMKAWDLDKLLPSGAWYEDRDYPHKFVSVDQIPNIK